MVRNPQIEESDWMKVLLSIRIDWPRPEDDALYVNPVTKRLNLSQDFETHISKVKNWRMDASLCNQFHALRGLIEVY